MHICFHFWLPFDPHHDPASEDYCPVSFLEATLTSIRGRVVTWSGTPGCQTRVSFPRVSLSPSRSLTLQGTPFLDISYHMPGSGPGADNTEWRAQARPQGPPGPEAAEMCSCPPPEGRESRHTTSKMSTGAGGPCSFSSLSLLSFPSSIEGRWPPEGGSRKLHSKTAKQSRSC